MVRLLLLILIDNKIIKIIIPPVKKRLIWKHCCCCELQDSAENNDDDWMLNCWRKCRLACGALFRVQIAAYVGAEVSYPPSLSPSPRTPYHCTIHQYKQLNLTQKTFIHPFLFINFPINTLIHFHINSVNQVLYPVYQMDKILTEEKFAFLKICN